MTVYRTTLALAAFATLLLITDTRISASDQLNRARELYQAAAYDEALMALDGGTADPAEAVEIRQYRVLCLIALDRRDEAERAMAALVDDSPFYRLPEDETSPRVRALFAEVRRSVLPGIVQRTYANAKAAFDRKDPNAAERFDRVLALLNDPDLAGDGSLADLATVAAGFRDLSRAAAPVVPATVEKSPAGQRPAAVAASASALPGSSAEIARGGIVPPMAISQVLPPIQTSLAREWVGEIEVVIDADGKVASARMIRSINPGYDTQLLRAALSARDEGWGSDADRQAGQHPSRLPSGVFATNAGQLPSRRPLIRRFRDSIGRHDASIRSASRASRPPARLGRSARRLRQGGRRARA